MELIGRDPIANMQEMIEYIEIPQSLKQNFVVISERQKYSFLTSLLAALDLTKGIIFVATADQSNYMEKLLNSLSYQFEDTKAPLHDTKIINPDQKIFKLHGHIKQEERGKIFNDFNNSKHAWLISTDVGCRGLDFKDTNMIILFDVPQDITDYINRIGRTARINQAGNSLLFLNYAEELFAEKIIETFHIQKFNPINIFNLFIDKIKAGEAQWENTHQYLDNLMRKFASNDRDNYYLARRAYNSFCRAYARLRDRECFN
jgi:ATP-dependent RNA helicase DDX31/DBP7